MSVLTVKMVLAKVKAIEVITGDNEVAHSAEDRLYIEVLHAIAGGHSYPLALAQAALKAGDLDFDRWYA